MELNQAVSTLQEEMKLLKGEIKTVLKDIRAAVLSNDNPFALDSTTVAAISNVAAPSDEPPVVEEEEEPEVPTEPELEPALSDGPSTPPTAGPTGPPLTGGPGAPPGGPPGGPMGPGTFPGAPGGPAAAAEPTPLHPKEQEEPDGPPELRWNLLTIAGLMTWAEEAVGTLGRQRFEIVLELACVADLISTDVRDVLMRIAQLAPAKDVQNQPMNVIEGLVVLHELEAILQGEKITRLSRRRGERRPGALVWSSA
jgi:hypothetical protein